MSTRRREANCAFTRALMVFAVLGILTSQGHAQVHRSCNNLTCLDYVKVSPKVVQSNLISQVQPVYPEYAKQKHIHGAVILSAMIDERGTVNNLSVASGRVELIQAAMDAVKQWRYRPYLVNGKPVWVASQITVTFSLPKDSSGSTAPPSK